MLSPQSMLWSYSPLLRNSHILVLSTWCWILTGNATVAVVVDKPNGRDIYQPP